MTTQALRRWYSVEEAADALQVSIHTVYNACKAGKMRHRKVGRRVVIHPDEVEAVAGTPVVNDTPSKLPVSERTGQKRGRPRTVKNWDE